MRERMRKKSAEFAHHGRPKHGAWLYMRTKEQLRVARPKARMFSSVSELMKKGKG